MRKYHYRVNVDLVLKSILLVCCFCPHTSYVRNAPAKKPTFPYFRHYYIIPWKEIHVQFVLSDSRPFLLDERQEWDQVCVPPLMAADMMRENI